MAGWKDLSGRWTVPKPLQTVITHPRLRDPQDPTKIQYSAQPMILPGHLSADLRTAVNRPHKGPVAGRMEVSVAHRKYHKKAGKISQEDQWQTGSITGRQEGSVRRISGRQEVSQEGRKDQWNTEVSQEGRKDQSGGSVADRKYHRKTGRISQK